MNYYLIDKFGIVTTSNDRSELEDYIKSLEIIDLSYPTMVRDNQDFELEPPTAEDFWDGDSLQSE